MICNEVARISPKANPEKKKQHIFIILYRENGQIEDLCMAVFICHPILLLVVIYRASMAVAHDQAESVRDIVDWTLVIIKIVCF